MILVVGATGDLGAAITRLLLDRGERVRALVRSSSYESLTREGVEVVRGDLKDRASLDAAVKDVDVVITTANSARRGGDDNPQTVELEGNRNLIDAARSAGVKQFIFISAQIANASSPVPFLAGKGQSEEYLRASGMPYTIIAPNMFMEVWTSMLVGAPARAGRPVTLVGEGRRQHSFISAGDVARFVVAAVRNPNALNKRLVIGGPKPLSLRDVAGVYGRVLGREVPVRSVAPGEPIPGVPDTVLGIAAGLDRYDSPVDMEETTRTFGIHLTSLEEVARRECASE
ncbi:MAG TPA: SDR family oxidoreductase [Gemmatimonadaceae bacterium]|nr:SDR family oxidoreductase [Gemmatimonadaceae bacterium]